MIGLGIGSYYGSKKKELMHACKKLAQGSEITFVTPRFYLSACIVYVGVGTQMIHQKSVKGLKNILLAFKSKLMVYDEDAKRNKNSDYTLLPQGQLEQILRSRIPVEEKKKLLLSQIGLLRINLFSECYERTKVLEESKQIDEAVKLMNDYAENVAIPFIPAKKKPSLINRFTDLLSLQRPLEPFEYVQKWRTLYRTWFEGNQSSMHSYTRESQRLEMFNQLRITFNMVYTASFSDDNFPPSPTIIFVDPTRIKV